MLIQSIDYSIQEIKTFEFVLELEMFFLQQHSVSRMTYFNEGHWGVEGHLNPGLINPKFQPQTFQPWTFQP